MFTPAFRITPAITRALMQIEACRQAVLELPIDVALLQSLRETARVTSIHFSTMIEGNRLTEPQVREVLQGARFPGRERDEAEVRNYFRALAWVEIQADTQTRISIADVKRLHGLAFHGRNRGTPFRDGQNVIRDTGSGRIVYLPPETPDVPGLMRDLIAWAAAELASEDLPAPVIAALAHYQLATIHPWYDGNGRTARLLATLILQRASYGLKGLYSLDAYYAEDLPGYYRALAVGPSHNDYEGRAEADFTGFVGYFCAGMAEAFAKVRAAAAGAGSRGAKDQAARLRQLDPRQRRVLELFRGKASATSVEIAACLGLKPRTVVALCRGWVAEGFLEMADASRRRREYRLAEGFEGLVGR